MVINVLNVGMRSTLQASNPFPGVAANANTTNHQLEGKVGRSEGKKRQVVLAIQVDTFGIHRSYAGVIPSATSIELEAFFYRYIDRKANIRTDGWTGYQPLKTTYPNLNQEKSENGA